MVAGYIYVFLNSSMPDLVNVGKTTQLPSERAKELSSSTGAPTPFIVAFEEHFADCDSAEDAVYCELEACGFRQSQNRGFFRAKSNEVIRAIMDVASRKQTASIITEGHRNEAPLWSDFLRQADELLEGSEEELQDVDEALRLYKLAAHMESSEACSRLGYLYFYGSQVRQDHREALSWFKEATKRGEYSCFMHMARIFLQNDQRENAMKCFSSFFKAHSKWLDGLPLNPNNYSSDVEQYLHICLDNNLPVGFWEFTVDARAALLKRVEPRLQDKLSSVERQELTCVRDILLRT